MDGGGWWRRRRRKRRRHCRSFNRMEYRAEHSRQILTCVQRAGTAAAYIPREEGYLEQEEGGHGLCPWREGEEDKR